MNKYVLGVDGGGTKTHCALFDIEGNRIVLVNWGATNHETLKGGFAELEEQLRALLGHILDKNRLNQCNLGMCVFGLSGVDTRSQYITISNIIKRLGISDFILCNDAYLGVKAGCRSGYGICAINGTGCTVAGIDPSGGMLQIGGQSDLTGDIGGGWYLGKRAVSAVYNALLKNYKRTVMSEIMFEMLNIQSRHDYMDTLTEQLDCGKIRVKDLNKVVFMAANMGDKVALDILEEMGRENARSINAVITELKFPEKIDVVLAGSIYIKGENPMAVDKIKHDVIKSNPSRDIKIEKLEYPPVAGAVIWAL